MLRFVAAPMPSSMPKMSVAIPNSSSTARPAGGAPVAGSVPAALHAHHVRYFARNLAAHRDPRNRLVHLVATLVGFSCIVSMLARVSIGPTDLGALLAITAVLYFAPFEPLAALVIAATVSAARLLLGPHFGQAGVGPVRGLGTALGVFLAFNLFGVYTHRLFNDPIIASGSTEKLVVRLLKTAHTILFSVGHFVSFALFALGYRGRLRAEIVAAADRQAALMGRHS
jgi:uncharacterized membrane protein YGL010W